MDASEWFVWPVFVVTDGEAGEDGVFDASGVSGVDGDEVVVAHVGEVVVAVFEEGLLGLDFLEGDDIGVDGVDGHGGGDELVFWFGVVDVFIAACEGGVVVGIEEIFDVVGG